MERHQPPCLPANRCLASWSTFPLILTLWLLEIALENRQFVDDRWLNIPIKNGWCSWCSTKLPGGLQPVARNFAAYPRFHRPRWRPAYWPWSFGSAFRLFGATSWRKRHPAEGLRVTWVFFLGACRAQWVYPEWGYRWIRWYDCPQCIPILDKRNLCQPYDNGDIMRILSMGFGGQRL